MRFAALCIQGEITNFKPNTSGHLYFDLKDAGAKISAVMFKNAATSLSRLPKEGDQVIIKGALSVYAPHGRYQIIVHSLQFVGVGELLLKLEELKKKLKSLGFFEKERKKPLPKFPKCIGIVTSPTGSVIRDMIHVISRKCRGFHIILNPVKVQGAEAALEIAQAIDAFNKYKLADVLIVGRGGGSLEDLWPFNEEVVATAIFKSEIPIVSAVGHETDFTLADFVADVRAPTPSAAAEIVIRQRAQTEEFLQKMQGSIIYALSHLLKRYQEKLKRFSHHPLFATPYSLTGTYFQKVDDAKKEVERLIFHFLKEKKLSLGAMQKQLVSLNPASQMSAYKKHMLQIEKRLESLMHNQIAARKQKIKQLTQTLVSLDPKNVLKRGYSILFAIKNGSVIVSAESVCEGDNLSAQLSDGKIDLKVVKHD